MRSKKNKIQIVLLLIICFLLAVYLFVILRDDIHTYFEQKRTVTVYLIRHGQTEANVNNINVGGGSDSPLTDTGITESQKLGTFLKDIKFQNAYSSELKRAVTTESLVLSQNNYWDSENKEIITMSCLDDINLGNAENLPLSDAVAQYGTEVTDYGNADDQNFVPVTGGENKYTFIQRFDHAMKKIVETEENHGKNVIVAAHSSASFWLQKKFPYLKDNGLKNDSYTILTYDGDEFSLISYNNSAN